MTIFAAGLSFPGAPVLLPDGNFLCVEMGEDRGCVTWISADGHARKTLAKTGRPNGLALGRDMNIWVTETRQRALLRMDLDGRYETVIDERQGEQFTFLNDIVVAPNGDLYLTDSGIEMDVFAPGGVLNPDYRNLEYDGRVYRLDPHSREIEMVDDGYFFANGIAFGPDQNLYVSETFSGTIFRYPWQNGRAAGPREVFANVLDPDLPEGPKGPDSMKFGKDGKLYVAVFGQGDITVLDPDGTVDRRIKAGGLFPTNLVFGPEGEQSIYVTEAETGTIRTFKVDTDGYPLNT